VRVATSRARSTALTWILVVFFKRAAAIDVLHLPYKSVARAMLDFVAGRLSFTLDGVAIHCHRCAREAQGPRRDGVLMLFL
jgi:tripartite-type tricarboxylate transporter receptor subunit TctC